MKLNVASHLDKLEFVMFAASALTSVSFLVGASVMGTCKTHGVHELVSKVVVVVVGKVLVVVLVLVAVLDVLEVFSACCCRYCHGACGHRRSCCGHSGGRCGGARCGSCGSNHCRRWVEEAIVQTIAQGGPTSSEQLRPDPTMAL